MKPKIGQYFYTPCKRMFRIYRYTSVTDNSTTAEPTCEQYGLREEARRRVYQLNGWKYNGAKTSSQS